MVNTKCSYLACASSKKREASSSRKPPCSCLQLKELRDITPLYPVLRSWLANKLRIARVVEAEVGSGAEARISNIKIGHFMAV